MLSAISTRSRMPCFRRFARAWNSPPGLRTRDTLRKQQEELRVFDEKLRHYADMRISLDLDDGVKVNYGKFGDLLAEVKAVTGKSASDD